MPIIIVLAVLAGLAYRVTTPEERDRYHAIAIRYLRRLKIVMTESRPEDDLFRDGLRARTAYVFVTPAIVLINAAVLAGIIFGGPPAGGDKLVAWGASLGPRTTNGEWWRLVSSTFVHTGIFHFLVNAVFVIQLGRILERLVGRLLVSAVYVSAGAFAVLVDLSSHPLAVTVGSSGAVFGLYGLLVASLIWQTFYNWRKRPHVESDDDVDESASAPVTIPSGTLKRLAIGAVVFVAYGALAGLAGTAEFTGLLAGLAFGVVLARRASEETPTARPIGIAWVAAGVIALISAITLRNIVDVQPEIARVVAMEERTAAAYQAGFAAFRNGRKSAESLAQFAEGSIVPELQAADAHLKALANVPPEHQPLIANAREYVRLRCASWRARAGAIRYAYIGTHRPVADVTDERSRIEAEKRFRSDLAVIATAEGAERAAREAFQRISAAAVP